MARTWKRSGVDTMCGYCPDQRICVGDPVFEIRGATWKVIRCRVCAGEPVPDDLPPLAAQSPMVPMKLVRTGPGLLPLDWKQRQVGEEG